MLMSRELLAVAILSGLAGGAQAAGSDPLAGHRWRERVLVVIAPDARHPALAQQREIFRKAASGTHERDLVLVEGIGRDREDEALRERFAVPAGEFRAILVGKDGGDKLTASEPIAAERLFSEIDSMPMRRNEIGQRRP